MDADVTVSSSKWRNKSKAFWVLFDKCLCTPDYWLGAAFLLVLFVKTLIKSCGEILQTPCRQQLCLQSEEFRENLGWADTPGLEFGSMKTIIFQQGWQLKDHFTKIAHGWVSTCPPHSLPAMLYKKTFISRSERQDLQAAVEETCLPLCIKICPSNYLEFLSHKIITQECSEASVTGITESGIL